MGRWVGRAAWSGELCDIAALHVCSHFPPGQSARPEQDERLSLSYMHILKKRKKKEKKKGTLLDKKKKKCKSPNELT